MKERERKVVKDWQREGKKSARERKKKRETEKETETQKSRNSKERGQRG